MTSLNQANTESPNKLSSHISLVPFVGLGVGWFFMVQANRLRDAGTMSVESFDALIVWIVALGVWGLLMSWLSLSGNGRNPAVLKLLPGLWLPPLPVLGTALAITLSPALRWAFLALASGVPEDQLILVQVLRIAAIGSVIKTSLGRLPPAFGFGTGIPDLLFGISAAALLLTDASTLVPPTLLIAWNIIGALILILAALILQLCLPGPLQIFRREPDGRELLDFPLFLAPALFGPVLLIGNCLQVAKYVLQGL